MENQQTLSAATVCAKQPSEPEQSPDVQTSETKGPTNDATVEHVCDGDGDVEMEAEPEQNETTMEDTDHDVDEDIKDDNGVKPLLLQSGDEDEGNDFETLLASTLPPPPSLPSFIPPPPDMLPL